MDGGPDHQKGMKRKARDTPTYNTEDVSVPSYLDPEMLLLLGGSMRIISKDWKKAS